MPEPQSAASRRPARDIEELLMQLPPEQLAAMLARNQRRLEEAQAKVARLEFELEQINQAQALKAAVSDV